MQDDAINWDEEFADDPDSRALTPAQRRWLRCPDGLPAQLRPASPEPA